MANMQAEDTLSVWLTTWNSAWSGLKISRQKILKIYKIGTSLNELFYAFILAISGHHKSYCFCLAE